MIPNTPSQSTLDEHNRRLEALLNNDPIIRILNDYLIKLQGFKNQDFVFTEAIKIDSGLAPPINLPPELQKYLSTILPITTVSQIRQRVDKAIGEQGLKVLDQSTKPAQNTAANSLTKDG